MWRQSIISLLVIGAAIFCLGCFPGNAAAQYDQAARAIAMERPVGLKDVPTMLAPKPIPVRLLDVQVPELMDVGESASFSALANVENATLPIWCEWDFGDGTTANSLHAHHRFSEPGNHQVTLRLWNAHGEVRESFTVRVVSGFE